MAGDSLQKLFKAQGSIAKKPDPKTALGQLRSQVSGVASPSGQGSNLQKMQQSDRSLAVKTLQQETRRSFEIAIDWSASTVPIAENLKKLTISLRDKVRQLFPGQKDLSFGIFGGENTVKSGQSSSVLESERCTTPHWESTFDRYLAEFISANLESFSSGKPVIISFHDAACFDNETLRLSAEKLNQKEAVLFSCVIDSSGDECPEARQEALRVLKSVHEKHFHKGLVIDLTSYDLKDQNTLETVIKSILEVLKENDKQEIRDTGKTTNRDIKDFLETRISQRLSDAASKGRLSAAKGHKLIK